MSSDRIPRRSVRTTGGAPKALLAGCSGGSENRGKSEDTGAGSTGVTHVAWGHTRGLHGAR